MADDLQRTPLSQEDKQWLNTPITVQVPPDNQAWLDTLLEMSPDELRTFAVYNYQIPVEAARAVGRNELIQLIVSANLAGQYGGSGLRPKYKYLPALKGIFPPEITTRRGRLLYLTRGEGDTMQIHDKRVEARGTPDEWISYRRLVPQEPTTQQLASKAAEDGTSMLNEYNPAVQRRLDRNDSPTPTPEGNPPGTLPPEVVLAALPRMNRGDLEKVVKSLGVEDASDARFPNAESLRDFIKNALTTKIGSEGVATNGQN